MTKYKKGRIIRGTVTGIEAYGAFVSCDEYYSGLIHISEISHNFVKNITDFVNVGDVIFVEILDGLDSVSIISKEEKEEKFISTIAYKSAVKAKINLDDNEIADVLNQLLSLNNPFVCADNKQIAIKMSKIDFEKKFSRR